MFNNNISIDAKSKVIYRISVLCYSHVKNLKNKINYYRRQSLEFSRISEMKISFITSLDFLTYKHFMEQRIRMIERILNRKLYKKMTSF